MSLAHDVKMENPECMDAVRTRTKAGHLSPKTGCLMGSYCSGTLHAIFADSERLGSGGLAQSGLVVGGFSWPRARHIGSNE